MARADETEVVVVGAGPVGMLAALMLAQNGIRTQIIDKERRTATHSYACVLHPSTLRLLRGVGLADQAIARGRRIETVALYDANSRCGEMKFSRIGGEFPFALVVPQNVLEDLLQEHLNRMGHAEFLWNHRLSDLKSDADEVQVTIEKLAQTAKGYIVAEWDWTVQKTLQTRAKFVVGADGHGSIVRSRLGIEYKHLAASELFAVFEFETGSDPGDEVRIVMADASSNVLWPLPGNRCRWSFELVKTRKVGEFPEKDRESARIAFEKVDEGTRKHVEALAQKRAPWFKGNIKNFDWWAHIRFEHSLAQQFGKGRVLLAGDAAHQTGPVGVQSMNAGLAEAEDLARLITQSLRKNGSPAFLQQYEQTHRSEWETLLGLRGGLNPTPQTDPRIGSQASRLLSCIPALGADLDGMINQVGLSFRS